MDAEELSEIKELKREGRPETTRGPYYHKAWWEGYKGGVKGLLGGVIIGGGIGALIGLGSAGALSMLIGPAVGEFTGAIVAGMTAFGMWEGSDKFERVGIAAGAQSAVAEVGEVRMKEYVREKFRGLTNEIRELKAALKGTKSMQDLKDAAVPVDNSPVLKDDDFRTSHQDEHTNGDRRLFYPNVMAVGTVVGALVGMALGSNEFAEETLKEFLGKGATGLAEGSTVAALGAVGAMAGASFGISRDIFRSVFDVTDRLFLGLVRTPEKEQSKAPTRTYDLRRPAPTQEQEVEAASLSAFYTPEFMPAAQQRVLLSPSPDVTLTESPIISANHHQNLVNAGKQALMGLDPTTAIRH